MGCFSISISIGIGISITIKTALCNMGCSSISIGIGISITIKTALCHRTFHDISQLYLIKDSLNDKILNHADDTLQLCRREILL